MYILAYLNVDLFSRTRLAPLEAGIEIGIVYIDLKSLNKIQTTILSEYWE